MFDILRQVQTFTRVKYANSFNCKLKVYKDYSHSFQFKTVRVVCLIRLARVLIMFAIFFLLVLYFQHIKTKCSESCMGSLNNF